MQAFQTKVSKVQAIQFTKQLALECLIDKKQIPCIFVSGHYHEQKREVYSFRATTGHVHKSKRINEGDWVVFHPGGDVSVWSDEGFRDEYEESQ